MSRARQASTAYVVADDLDQAREDLTRDWATRRTPTWAIDTGLPSPQQASSDLGSISKRERVGIVAVRHAHDRLLADATQPGRPPAHPEGADDVRTALTRPNTVSPTSPTSPPSPASTPTARSATPPGEPNKRPHVSPGSSRRRPPASGSSGATPAVSCPR
ncbi:MAG: hypothetical protein ACYCUG_06805 [Acidimicrobiales bacterium]